MYTSEIRLVLFDVDGVARESAEFLRKQAFH
jgi:phosphoglycolate phosphatase-like HAD superfamily hydrolase